MNGRRVDAVAVVAPRALVCHTVQGPALLVWAADPLAGRALAAYADDVAAEDAALAAEIRRSVLAGGSGE